MYSLILSHLVSFFFPFTIFLESGILFVKLTILYAVQNIYCIIKLHVCGTSEGIFMHHIIF